MQSKIKLSQLTKVDIRQVWNSESQDFTPWLAEECNIQLLGDTIGMELEVEAQEKDVGMFRADILCKEVGTGDWVLIENQLERTDHCHLGQLMTYAAGLKAVTIVWVASRFTDEHRAALDWLNEITSGDFKFFGLEVEVWRIGESEAAPKFNIVCAPNNWSQDVSERKREIENGDLTGAKSLQLAFWHSFREYALKHATAIVPTKALPQTWMDLAIGRTGFRIALVASTWDSGASDFCGNELRAEFVCYNDAEKHIFAKLISEKATLEAEFGGDLLWAESPGKKQSKIYVRRSVNLEDRESWPDYVAWLCSNADRLYKLFSGRVKML